VPEKVKKPRKKATSPKSDETVSDVSDKAVKPSKRLALKLKLKSL